MATPSSASSGAWPRGINIVAGIWLFISAFIWPHAANARTNTWILGVLIALAAIIALYAPRVRFLNTLFAIWLFFSTLFIYHLNAGTLWNNIIVSIIVFIVSLIPSRAGGMGRFGAQRPLPA